MICRSRAQHSANLKPAACTQGVPLPFCNDPTFVDPRTEDVPPCLEEDQQEAPILPESEVQPVLGFSMNAFPRDVHPRAPLLALAHLLLALLLDVLGTCGVIAGWCDRSPLLPLWDPGGYFFSMHTPQQHP